MSRMKVASLIAAGIGFAAVSMAANAAMVDEAAVPPGQVKVATIATKKGPPVFTNTDGQVLYFFDQDRSFVGVEFQFRSTCVNQCRKDWPPLMAPKGAVAVGDWSLISRVENDDEMQWAYKGRLAYTKTNEPPGDAKGEGFLWHLLRYDTPPKVMLAGGATVQKSDKKGWLFATAGARTLYTPTDGKACDTTCLKTWRPVSAPALASPVGPWTIVKHTDGSRQWAYKGKPVFTFPLDKTAGDTFGDQQPGWSLLLAEEPVA